jgi:hypothetical protein
MSVSELEQAELIHGERRMVITSSACDIINRNLKEKSNNTIFICGGKI